MTKSLIITGTKDANGFAVFGGRGGMGGVGERERSAGRVGHNLGDSMGR